MAPPDSKIYLIKYVKPMLKCMKWPLSPGLYKNPISGRMAHFSRFALIAVPRLKATIVSCSPFNGINTLAEGLNSKYLLMGKVMSNVGWICQVSETSMSSPYKEESCSKYVKSL